MDFTIEQVCEYTQVPARASFRLHTHDMFEIYCFLEGDAAYFVEGTRYPLKPGDVVLMRKGESHFAQLLSDTGYRRIYVHFDFPAPERIDPEGILLAPFQNRPLGTFNHFPAEMFPDNHWLFYLQQMEKCSTELQKLYYLLPLLMELSEDFQTVKAAGTGSEKAQISYITEYINAHLAEDLSMSLLEEKFYISKTHLNRLFRQSVGTTVWEYITVKRLFRAKDMIRSGQAPSKVYLRCGFKDYSTFFRAYKQKFGLSPRADSR